MSAYQRPPSHNTITPRKATIMSAPVLFKNQPGETYKSRPTIFSSTELFPLDCDPTTAIWGKSILGCTYRYHQPSAPSSTPKLPEIHTPTVAKTSCSLFTRVIKPGSLTLILHVTSQLVQLSNYRLVRDDSGYSGGGIGLAYE